MSESNKLGFEPIPLGSPPRNPDMASLGLLPPLPKPTTPVEPRSSLPRTELPAVKTEAVVTDAAKPPVPGRLAWVPEAIRMMFKPTKQKGVMAAGLASLACGVLVANWMWPAPKPTSETVQIEPVIPPPPETAPSITVTSVPAVSVEPLRLPPPSVTVDPPKVPDVPPITLPPLNVPKVDPNVKPMAGVEAPLIDLPKIEPAKMEAAVPPVPRIELPKSEPKMELPSVAPAAPPVLPKIDVPPPVIVETKPAPPPPLIVPEKKDPVFVPTAPATPPMIETPKPAPPVIETPKPAPPRDLPKPVTAAPREDYDVDVHYVASGDTWAGVSKAQLGDDRYAEALRAYNAGRPLVAGQGVDVPPIHVLRKNYANLIAAPRTVEPAAREVTRTAGGLRNYEIPAGGMTLKELARKALGDENYWGQIWELNPKLRADEPVPQGTRIRLPADARVGE